MQSTGHGVAHVGVSTRNGLRLVSSAMEHGRLALAIGHCRRPTTTKTTGKVLLGRSGKTGKTPVRQAADHQVVSNMANLGRPQPIVPASSSLTGKGRDPAKVPKARSKGRLRRKGFNKIRFPRSKTANRDLLRGPRSILPSSRLHPS